MEDELERNIDIVAYVMIILLIESFFMNNLYFY